MPDLPTPQRSADPPAAGPLACALRWWRAIPLADRVDRRNAAMLQLVLVFVGLYQLIAMLMAWWRAGAAIDSVALWLAGFNALAMWVCFALLRRGAFLWAARLFVVVSLALLTVGYARWGLEAQLRGQLGQLLPALIGGLLLSRRALWGAVAWLALVVALGAWRDAARMFFLPSLWPRVLEVAVGSLVGFVVVALVLDQSVAALRDSLALARKRGNDLARSRDRLQLEMQEKERSRDQLVHAQKMESVGRLASGVAHDFNHLLSLIMGYAARARRSDDPQQLKAALQGADAAARRAAAVTRKLLDFSRQEATRLEVFEPAETIAGMRPMFDQLFGLGVQVRLHLHEAPCPVRFDRAQLELILLNLAANAQQAMPEGGQFELTLAPRPDATLEIAVRDSGHGMSEDVRARCLEPFFTTKPSGQGTGLGLAVSANLIAAAGGALLVESAPGQGSVFRLRLPLHAGATAVS
ncbi:ATP-binding protein [Xanthomonas bonasiae]|uniref:ATP-binding protein n=1 Tax=Xanthomonas bonasiae TaxID=2810351 RepID=UPI0019800027|nr:ATP-binding protein [Xanthomonas bonasiae]MBN6112930.1 histidine kinase [Xanthomonas bonasiae]